MEIHKRIADARKKLGFTQEQLADLTDITVRTIQRIENGKSVPRAFTVKSIATALGTTFEELTKESQNDNPLVPEIENSLYTENEKHFLKILCLSCFSYLVIPFVHFLIPFYLLKNLSEKNPQVVELGRSIVRQQIYWVVMLSLSLLLTMAYNFIIVVYLKEFYILHYLWVFFSMYLLNVFFISLNLWRIKDNHYRSKSG